MSTLEPTIPEDVFERVLQEAIVRPAGRSFRGEPARQVALLRILRARVRPVAFDEIFKELKREGVIRAAGDDGGGAAKKAVREAIAAVNDKLGTFFFRVKDIRLLSEMFRVGVLNDDGERPAAVLQDFFGIRKTSGVRFFATSDEPAGGLTRELYELVTEIRPRRMDVFAASFSSFLGNPEFRQLLEWSARQPDGRLRFLLLDPKSATVDAIERAVKHDVPLRGAMRARVESSLRALQEIEAQLDKDARKRFVVRTAASAPLWRFRMIFLDDVLHLRLVVPNAPTETLIKLDAESSLYRSLHDVFEEAWEEARSAV